MLKINNITHNFGKFRVLEDVSYQFVDNAVTALIGANGAGKSTLLNMVSRLLVPDSGEVWLDGRQLKEYKSKDIAKKIAILKQTQHMNIRININDLVEFGRFPHCGGRLQEADRLAIEEAIGYMDLQDIRHKYLDELSGGQRQRAYIAMILAQDTPYILLDEPLNNLDIKYSVEMMKIVRRLVADLNKTVIVVLHDINFAAAYADKIVAMKDGKIFADGEAKDLLNSSVLRSTFDYDFRIAEVDDKKVCLYF